MKMIVRRTALAVCTLVLAVILPTAASAACTGFDDVPESADCYESVMYLAKCEIVAGMGNECFSPEQLITVEQWAVMLCRAYGVETIGDNWQDVGRSSVVEAYRQGWLNETALSAPRSPMCRSVLVESAFAAADVPVYDSTLYEGGASLSTADNILRVGRELGLCSDDADTNALVTRGDAAIILHVVLTQSFRIEEPPVPVALVNAAGVNINDYLLALRQGPEGVMLCIPEGASDYETRIFAWEGQLYSQFAAKDAAVDLSDSQALCELSAFSLTARGALLEIRADGKTGFAWCRGGIRNET